MGFLNFYVLFRIHSQNFALKAKHIVTIIKEGEINLSGDSSLVYGEIELEEKTVPMINLSKALNLPFRIPLKNAVIIIVEGERGSQAGIIVDSIEELSLIENDKVDNSETGNTFFLGQTKVNNQATQILDPNKIVELL